MLETVLSHLKKPYNILRRSFTICGGHLFPGSKDFGDISHQNVITILYLSKLHAVVQRGKMDASARYVLLRSLFKTRFFSFITFNINKVLNVPSTTNVRFI